MPYAVIERDFNELTEDRKHAVVLFVHFLASQQAVDSAGSSEPSGNRRARFHGRKIGGFEKGFRMAEDFDAPLQDFAEYMK